MVVHYCIVKIRLTGDCSKARAPCWLPTQGRISSCSLAALCQHGNPQDKLYPKAMHLWKARLSLISMGTASIPKSANRICQFVMPPTTSCFQAWWKLWAVSESKDQTANCSLGGKGRYKHSTFATELLADWWLQASDFNSYNAGPHGI